MSDIDEDSIAPGARLSGFGLRSTYYPAIREVKTEPTRKSCCRVQPDPDVDVLPNPRAFAVSSWALMPGYMPEDVTIVVLQSQLSTFCSDPLWLANGTLCSEFEVLLTAAARDERAGYSGAAAARLIALWGRVDQEQAQMTPEAYWLLHHNVRQAYRNVVR